MPMEFGESFSEFASVWFQKRIIPIPAPRARHDELGTAQVWGIPLRGGCACGELGRSVRQRCIQGAAARAGWAARAADHLGDSVARENYLQTQSVNYQKSKRC